MMEAVLLSPDDPPAFEVQGRNGRSPFFCICDHAGRLLPRALGDLGVAPVDLTRHIAWDIGAGGLARRLGQVLDACVVWQRYSRLVIDCNRHLDAPDSIATRSERTEVPGNRDLTAEAAGLRAREIFHPYHDEIRQSLDRRQAEGRPTILVAVHSFTPVFHEVSRPWQAGVLYGADARFAAPVLAALRAEGDLVVGDNQPYAVTPSSDFSVNHHAERRSLPYVEIEIRQDLIADEAGQQAWADRLARVFTAVLQANPQLTVASAKP